jgi:hypothetical protein
MLMGPTAAPEVVEIMRLERQLAARDEVIRQLNRQLHDQAPGPPDTEKDVDPEVMEEYVYKVRVLEDEIARLRQQLQPGASSPDASGLQLGDTESPVRRITARRIASALKRRILR